MTEIWKGKIKSLNLKNNYSHSIRQEMWTVDNATTWFFSLEYSPMKQSKTLSAVTLHLFSPKFALTAVFSSTLMSTPELLHSSCTVAVTMGALPAVGPGPVSQTRDHHYRVTQHLAGEESPHSRTPLAPTTVFPRSSIKQVICTFKLKLTVCPFQPKCDEICQSESLTLCTIS